MPPRLFDTHCHLDYLVRPRNEAHKPLALAEVLGRASAGGVERILTIATTISGWGEVLAATKSAESQRERAEGGGGGDAGAAAEGHAHALPRVLCTVGVHPHEAEAEGGTSGTGAGPEGEEPLRARLEAQLAEGGALVAAIGETGLDYHYDHSPRPAQQAAFREHIDVAARAGLPLVIHSRGAEDDTLAILREGREEWGPACTGVMHCFSEGRGLMEGALGLGFYISLSGIVTFKKAEALRELAAEIPADRLLIETDAPYLAPEPHRGKTNEPSYLPRTLERTAEARGEPVEETARLAWENSHRLFARFA